MKIQKSINVHVGMVLLNYISKDGMMIGTGQKYIMKVLKFYAMFAKINTMWKH